MCAILIKLLMRKFYLLIERREDIVLILYRLGIHIYVFVLHIVNYISFIKYRFFSNLLIREAI